MVTQIVTRHVTPTARTLHAPQPDKTPAETGNFSADALDRIGTRMVVQRGQTVFYEGEIRRKRSIE